MASRPAFPSAAYTSDAVASSLAGRFGCRFLRGRLALVALLALALASPAAASAALPDPGRLVAGQSLGGVRLGMTKAEVRKAWGKVFGRCRSCQRETWYFTYRPFEPQGAGVVFSGRVVAQAFTLWQPEGWRDDAGLSLGVAESELTRLRGSLPRRECSGYTALVLRGQRADSVFYLDGGKLWGFGLTRPGSSPCA